MDGDTLTRLVHESAVRDATARFADAATKGDLAAFRSLWTPDAEWRIGDHVHANGPDEIVDTFAQLRRDREFFVQFAVQGPIDIDGDTARTSTICHEQARGPGESYYRNHCVTDDRLAQDGTGSWLFSSRTFRYLWLDTSPFGGESFPVSP